MIKIQSIKEAEREYRKENKVWFNVKQKLTALNNLTTESNPRSCIVNIFNQYEKNESHQNEQRSHRPQFKGKTNILPPLVATLIKNFSRKFK